MKTKPSLKLLLLPLLALTGCQADPDYDLTNAEIDMTIEKELDLTLPVAAEFDKFVLGDIIDLSSPASDVSISADMNGDFQIEFNECSFDIPVTSPLPPVGTVAANVDIADNISLPEQFLANGGVIILNDLDITIVTDNNSPYDYTLEADLVAIKGGQEVNLIHIGGSSAPFTAKAGQSTNTISGLGSFLNPVPERIILRNINIKEATSGTGAAGLYNIAFKASIKAPLTLAEGSVISTEISTEGIDFGDLGIEEGGDTEVRLSKMALRFNVVNTLPVDMDITAMPLDDKGTEIPLSKNKCSAKAGSIEKPSVTENSIEYTGSEDALSKISTIKMNITIKGSKEFGSTTLNQNQSLGLTDAKADIKGKVIVYDKKSI